MKEQDKPPGVRCNAPRFAPLVKMKGLAKSYTHDLPGYKGNKSIRRAVKIGVICETHYNSHTVAFPRFPNVESARKFCEFASPYRVNKLA